MLAILSIAYAHKAQCHLTMMYVCMYIYVCLTGSDRLQTNMYPYSVVFKPATCHFRPPPVHYVRAEKTTPKKPPKNEGKKEEGKANELVPPTDTQYSITTAKKDR